MDREDPRITRSRRTVLQAAVDVLAEQGYGAFTIDAVARRSGVARSTIYRHWRRREDLVGDALDTLNVQPQAPIGSAGEARDAVLGLLRHLDVGLNDGPTAACLPALIDGAERNPGIRRLHHGQNDRRRGTLVRALAEALPGGEEQDGDADLLAHALAGALMYARLMTPRRFSDAQIERLVALILPAT
jgi:AcrR family transcriptional regulator